MSVRLRDNFIGPGELADAVSDTATTLKSPVFEDMREVVANDVTMTVVLDSLKADGDPEIVHVVAHAASSDEVTVERGMEGTTARAHSAGTRVEHGPTAEDFPELADTGWLRIVDTASEPGDAEWDSSWTAFNDSLVPNRYRRVGNTCYITGAAVWDGDGDPSIGLFGASVLFTLPTWMRPSVRVLAPAVTGDTATQAATAVYHTDGGLFLFYGDEPKAGTLTVFGLSVVTDQPFPEDL